MNYSFWWSCLWWTCFWWCHHFRSTLTSEAVLFKRFKLPFCWFLCSLLFFQNLIMISNFCLWSCTLEQILAYPIDNFYYLVIIKTLKRKCLNTFCSNRLIVQPLNVAAPSYTIIIESDSDEEDSIMCDQPSTSSHNFERINQIVFTEITSTDLPSSSNQLCSPIQTTHVSSPPTLLLDSIISKEVCENIFKDLNKLVKSRSNLIHN